MADVALIAQAVTTAPEGYTIPGAQEIILKSIFASFDGTGAGGSYVPTLQILAPNNAVVASCPVGSVLAAGASADVSWFPRVGGGGGGVPAGTLVIQLKVNSDQTLVSIGDGQLVVVVSDDMDGFALSEAAGYISAAGGTQTSVQVRNVTTGHDMLSTPITIDTAKFTSYASAVQPVVNASFATVATGQLLAVDVDAAGTNAEGLGVVVSFN